MRSLLRILSILGLLLTVSLTVQADHLDGVVVRVRMPNEDVSLQYVESKSGMTLKMESKSASIEGQTFYIGDGVVALKLTADPTKGIFFQNDTKLNNGHQFKYGSVITIQPGCKLAKDLAPGDIYVTLPGVTFKEK